MIFFFKFSIFFLFFIRASPPPFLEEEEEERERREGEGGEGEGDGRGRSMSGGEVGFLGGNGRGGGGKRSYSRQVCEVFIIIISFLILTIVFSVEIMSYEKNINQAHPSQPCKVSSPFPLSFFLPLRPISFSFFFFLSP